MPNNLSYRNDMPKLPAGNKINRADVAVPAQMSKGGSWVATALHTNAKQSGRATKGKAEAGNDGNMLAISERHASAKGEERIADQSADQIAASGAVAGAAYKSSIESRGNSHNNSAEEAGLKQESHALLPRVQSKRQHAIGGTDPTQQDLKKAKQQVGQQCCMVSACVLHRAWPMAIVCF